MSAAVVVSKRGFSMRLFSCDACKNTVHFDNDTCLDCERRLGYVPEERLMTALEPQGEHWHSAGVGRSFALCANAAAGACNWLIPAEEAGGYCLACQHNRVVPDLSTELARNAFSRMLTAERHLFYSLDAWRLPAPTKDEDGVGGLAFDFLADESGPAGQTCPVMTGHADGIITLAVSEADDAERERRRTELGEPFRTLLGHFRHEIGHYYWDRLVRDGGHLDAFRALFGDERDDYAAALDRNYREGPPLDWQDRHVSAYAACHPWEDFAETFAHYLHMVDALETASALGLRLEPKRSASIGSLDLASSVSPYHQPDFAVLAAAWPPLTVAVNELNRSFGQRDVYPFVLSKTVFDKLAFVHELIAAERREGLDA
jgi:hypothetical protein